MKLDESNIRDYAASLVAQVGASNKEMASRLDFSERSIWALEALIRASDEQFGHPEISKQATELTVFYGGCYLGETLARTLGGVWRFADDYAESSVVFSLGEGGLQVFPFQKLMKRVSNGAQGNDLVNYLEDIQAKLTTG